LSFGSRHGGVKRTRSLAVRTSPCRQGSFGEPGEAGSRGGTVASVDQAWKQVFPAR
jgi:hypothetical protein